MQLQPELGSGPLTAPLWVVGRDYGAEESVQRQPFVGQAGWLLNAALKSAGLDRATIRVDNLVPRQPRDNDFANHAPETLRWGQERLSALLTAYKPKVIVGFGNDACAWLVGEAWPSDGIQALRGYLWDSRFGRVLASVHPAAILRDWTPWRAMLDFDLARAKREVDAGAPPLDERTVHIVMDPMDARGFLAEAAACPLLSVDIENTQDLQLACCGFAPNTHEAWVVPAYASWQLNTIRLLCESATPKVLQNGQYDRFFLKRFAGITLRAQAFDTQLAWHALNPELAGKKAQVGYKKAASRRTAKSLAFLASIYLRVPHWKAYDFESDEERYILCGRDCCNTLEIAEKQMGQLEVAT